MKSLSEERSASNTSRGVARLAACGLLSPRFAAWLISSELCRRAGELSVWHLASGTRTRFVVRSQQEPAPQCVILRSWTSWTVHFHFQDGMRNKCKTDGCLNHLESSSRLVSPPPPLAALAPPPPWLAVRRCDGQLSRPTRCTTVGAWPQSSLGGEDFLSEDRAATECLKQGQGILWCDGIRSSQIHGSEMVQEASSGICGRR